MASTASKSIPLLKTIAHGAFQLGNHVVAELRTPRSYHCDIPNFEDDKPLRLYVDETQFGSGLWRVRETKDNGDTHRSYEKANIFDSFRYKDNFLISDPITTSQLLYMLDDMIDENRKHLNQTYIDSYEENIQAELKKILERENRRVVPQHPANEP